MMVTYCYHRNCIRPSHRSENRLVSIFLLVLFSVSAFGQNGPAPSYIESVPEYEVRSMSGSYAPDNGNLSMASVTPGEWLTNDPSTIGLNAVIIAWSGGAKGTGSKLFVHGGGHSDSANNGLYIYDFSGDDHPTGWLDPLVISGLSDVRANSATYSDGKPTAVHTYDGMVNASHNNHLYRFGGSQYDNGFMTNAAFKFNVATNEWTQIPDYPSQSGGAKTFYDPDTGNIFVTINNSLEGFFYRTDSDTWSGRKDYGGDGFPFNSGAARDTSRSRGILVGDGETSLVTINFSAETISVSSFNPTDHSEIFSRGGISAVYDSFRDVYWIFGGDTNSPGWTSIYEMSASGDPWTVIRHSLAGDTIQRASSMHGSWGRYVFMSQWRAIGLVASDTSAAYVIKLPSTQFKTPRAVSDLLAN